MKKRPIISLLTAVITGLSAAAIPLATELPTVIVAEAATNGTFQYSVSNGTVTIEKYLGTNPTVKIPSKINGLKVTKIADYAFAVRVPRSFYPDPMNITSVTFENPSYVKKIGDSAFYKAPLKELVLPASVKAVGEMAFYGCSAMKTLKIEGAAEIGSEAFSDCTSMYGVWLNENCSLVNKNDSPFNDCTALELINGSRTYTTSYDNHGWNKPKLTTNKAQKTLITNLFKSAKKVKFIDSYCSTLCRYIVDSETRSWMSEEIKARQLYVWLINHCEYEDQESDKQARDNHIYPSVFLSYGLNERGSGVGETVCQGFSQAYTMLLTAAGIESYVLVGGNTDPHGEDHNWNIIKVNNKYYQCDVTWDNDWYNQYGTKGLYFMRTAGDMDNLHHYIFNPVSVFREPIGQHNLLKYNSSTGTNALKKCTNYFYDTAIDGIRDSDFNFDGVVDSKDTQILQKIGSGDMFLNGNNNSAEEQKLYKDFCAVNSNYAHEYWLNLCIQYNILGS